MSSRERALQIKILDLETELRKKNEEQNQLVGKMSTVSTEWRVLKVSTNTHDSERGYMRAGRAFILPLLSGMANTQNAREFPSACSAASVI